MEYPQAEVTVHIADPLQLSVGLHPSLRPMLGLALTGFRSARLEDLSHVTAPLGAVVPSLPFSGVSPTEVLKIVFMLLPYRQLGGFAQATSAPGSKGFGRRAQRSRPARSGEKRES